MADKQTTSKKSTGKRKTASENKSPTVSKPKHQYTSASSSKSSRSGGANTPTTRWITIIVSLVVLCLAGYWLLSGNDPLGLFISQTQVPLPPTTETLVAPTPTTIGGEKNGGWWQVYFTDPNRLNNPDNLKGSIEEKLIEFINNAEESIHIAAFEFNLTPVAEALIAAHQRGVDVRWVTDDENGIEADEEEGHGQFATLENAGIEVKDDGRGALMHNKFIIFDDKTVWTGSTNITQNGIFRNNNNVIVIESPKLATIYEREFQEMWAGKFGPKSPSTLAEQSLTIDGTSIQVFFAAEDKVISHLIPLIKNAKKSIRFMAFSFTHDDLEAAVLERADAGVDVKGIFETRGSETEYSALSALYCAKIPVRQDGNPGTFHHKVFIIDGQIVITGSLNFSANADDSNDENTLVITNDEISRLYLGEFDARWAEATDPDPAKMACK